MKLLNVNQLSHVHSLDPLVRERMVEKIEILNENYGENRMIGDLGGFVMYVNHKEQLDELLEDYNLVIFMPFIVLEQYPQFNVSNE